MSLRGEIACVVIIKLLLLMALKNMFFDKPTISEDREALALRLVAPPAVATELAEPAEPAEPIRASTP